jgi:hypothetical protein
MTWNVYAWLAWGVLLVGIRLATELDLQAVARAEAADALEAAAEIGG